MGQLTYFKVTNDLLGRSRVLMEIQADSDLDYVVLNNIAWDIYLRENDEEILLQALNLAKKSIGINSSSFNNDTYAALLFKLGRKQDAIRYQKLALDHAKEEKAELKEYEEKLAFYQTN